MVISRIIEMCLVFSRFELGLLWIKRLNSFNTKWVATWKLHRRETAHSQSSGADGRGGKEVLNCLEWIRWVFPLSFRPTMAQLFCLTFGKWAAVLLSSNWTCFDWTDRILSLDLIVYFDEDLSVSKKDDWYSRAQKLGGAPQTRILSMMVIEAIFIRLAIVCEYLKKTTHIHCINTFEPRPWG